MVEVILEAIKFDDLLIGLLGHLVNDAVSKVTASAIKAVSFAAVASVFGVLRAPDNSARPFKRNRTASVRKRRRTVRRRTLAKPRKSK